ncbi:MAG: DUF167 domain-containing protein [Spirochaetes bacterium]|nr:MAG: DUF167 domain-containing protein [Spirochaetota bacterium]
MIIEVIAHTGSSKREIIQKDGKYHVYTPKKPIKGEANRDIIRILSENLNVPKSSISLVRGEKSKIKQFSVEAIDHH